MVEVDFHLDSLVSLKGRGGVTFGFPSVAGLGGMGMVLSLDSLVL